MPIIPPPPRTLCRLVIDAAARGRRRDRGAGCGRPVLREVVRRRLPPPVLLVPPPPPHAEPLVRVGPDHPAPRLEVVPPVREPRLEVEQRVRRVGRRPAAQVEDPQPLFGAPRAGR